MVKAKKRGSLRVDIHCHYLNTEVAAKVAARTDYPYDMGMEDPLGFIRKAGLGSADEKKVTGVNAVRLLKIDYNRSTRRRS